MNERKGQNVHMISIESQIQHTNHSRVKYTHTPRNRDGHTPTKKSYQKSFSCRKISEEEIKERHTEEHYILRSI